MKLYFAPGACSLSPHIVLREAGYEFSLEKVNLRTKQTASGQDYTAINPKGYVPALDLGNGEVLTEGPAIIQYVADKAPQSQLAPPCGTLERARVQEWLNFISTELHKNFSLLFNPDMPDEAKETARANLIRRLPLPAKALEKASHLTGEAFSVVDAYLFTVLAWAPKVKLDLSPWPSLIAFQQRVGARPSVRAALEAEGTKH